MDAGVQVCEDTPRRRPDAGVSDTMDLDLESPLGEHECAIRVALLPVGAIDAGKFSSLAALVHRFTALDLFALTHGKRRGAIRLRFVDAGGGVSDWDGLYPQRRVRAVIGLCHCPSEPDLGSSFAALVRQIEAFPHTAQVRCLIFDPPESGVVAQDLAPSIASRMVLMPPTHTEDVLASHVERLLEDLGRELLADLHAEAESAPSLPTTPVDSSSSTERTTVLRMMLSSVSSRLAGRHLKRKSDYQLLSGYTLEAKAGYERAIERLSRTGSDVVWHAAALEGAAAAHLIHLSRHLSRLMAGSGGSGRGGGGGGGGRGGGGRSVTAWTSGH